MRRDLITAVLAVLVATVVLGIAYPLAVTGLSQATMPGRAGGSLVRVPAEGGSGDGRAVGSRLIGQDFRGRPQYFQSRPSATGYAADATAFSNAGPNSARLRDELLARARAYLAREGRDNLGLRLRDIPADAVMTSASGIDPHISRADARIQAGRVARVRGLDRALVLALIDEHTDGRGLGILGDPGVNVLELNLALDRLGRR